jgi:hypothetical protein
MPETPLLPAARLYAILARATPKAVIFRRGPSKWVQLISWRTDSDIFTYGQWFHGHIYERRCDLSPSGKLLIYFASKITSKTLADPEYTYAWTAVSRPPYLTALALWPKGDCWHGGGLFKSEREVWLNHAGSRSHPNHRPRGLRVISNPLATGEDYPVWSRRIERDGWLRVQSGSYLPKARGWKVVQKEIWQRKQPAGHAVLQSTLETIDFRRPGGYAESFAVNTGGRRIEIPEIDWADWDQTGRLVFARAGKIFAGRINGPEVEAKLLADMNSSRPSPVAAPEWATK